MSSIMNLCYQLDCGFKSNAYERQITNIVSELQECQAQNDKWSEKLAEIEDKKANNEYYSIFDMKRCERKIQMYENIEARLSKKKDSLEKSDTIVSSMAEGFKKGASNVDEFSFNFA